MYRRILAVALLFAGFCCLGQQEGRSQLIGEGVWRKPAVAAVYTGPANVVASPVAWYGLRAMSTAARGTKIANVCTTISTVDTCVDMSSDATTGNMVILTIGGLTCNNSTQICNIKTLYDQTVGLACSSGTTSCDVTQATVANRPTLTVNCINTTLPCMTFNGSSQVLLSANALTFVPPYSMSAVQDRTNAAFGGSLSFQNSPMLGADTGANIAAFAPTGGAVIDGAASDNAWHAVQGTSATNSSDLSVDGGAPFTNVTTGISATNFITFGEGFANFFQGNLTEGGLWSVRFSGPQEIAMCHNQFTYWATSASC